MRLLLLFTTLIFVNCVSLIGQITMPEKVVLPVKFSVFLPEKIKTESRVVAVGLRGAVHPMSWEQDIQMSDKDGDGWWETVVDLPVPGYTEYKYIINGKDWENLEGNRFYYQSDNFLPGISDTFGEPNSSVFENYKSLVFSREKIAGDIRLMEKLLFTLHPGIYKYTDSASIAIAFNDALRSLPEQLNLSGAYLLFSKLTLLVKCGHTHTNFYNQNEMIKTLVLNGRDKLPLTLRYLDEKLIVEHNLSDNGNIKRGSIISAINGIPSDSVITVLKAYFRSDGNNEAQKTSFLNISGSGEFETFDVFFPLLFPPVNNEYSLEVLNPGEKVIKTSVKTLSRSERAARMAGDKIAVKNSYDDLWEFRVVDNKTAYLKLGTFVTWRMQMNWQEFIAKAFSTITDSGVTSLIIDIRGNEGGSDEAAEMISYSLMKKPSFANKFRSAARYIKIPEDLQAYLSSWDNSFTNLTKEVDAAKGGYYFQKGSPDRLVMLEQNPEAFTGRTYLLTDGSNSSGTFLMTNFLKSNELVVQVGEKTGGNKAGINGGKIIFARLPNTLIEFDIPVYTQLPFGDWADEGWSPDVESKQTYEDFLGGEDTVLKKAMQLIKELR